MDLTKLLATHRERNHLSSQRPGEHRRSLASTALLIAVAGCSVATGCGSAPVPPSDSTPVADPGPAPAPDEPIAAEVSNPTQPNIQPAVATPPEVVKPAPAAPKPAMSPLALADDGKPRLYAPAGLVKIHDKPDRNAPVIGAFRAGQSVVMTDTTLTPLRKLNRTYLCDEGWYPVAPRGFVCVGGGDHAVKNADDPRVIAARLALPDVSKPYSFNVGVSVGAPQYLRIPTAAEQQQIEGDIAAYKSKLPAGDDSKGGSVSTKPAGNGPAPALVSYFAKGKSLVHEQNLYEGYKISWAREFDANGRTWLLTPDLTLVPKDKVRVKATPTLEGINLKEHPEIKLPLAFFWLGDSTKYKPGPDGKLVATDEVIKRHSFVETTTDQAMGPGGLYWKLRDGSYVKYQDITVINKRPMRIGGVGPNDKWVEVRVTWGYLAAYRGDEIEYVTAISPGVDGINAAKHATARGKHHVDWKLYSGDMSGKDKGKEWYVDEVPWVQYYQGNYALHGAWWHNSFGRPMSHGCINLSPPDAKNLFDWMDPQIPEGWYAVATYYPYAKGTLVYIRP